LQYNYFYYCLVHIAQRKISLSESGYVIKLPQPSSAVSGALPFPGHLLKSNSLDVWFVFLSSVVILPWVNVLHFKSYWKILSHARIFVCNCMYVFVCSMDHLVWVGPSLGFRNRRGQKPQGGPHFLNTILDVCRNWGAKHEMGHTHFKMCGANTTGPLLSTTLGVRQINKYIMFIKHPLVLVLNTFRAGWFWRFSQKKNAVFGCLTNALASPPIALESCSTA